MKTFKIILVSLMMISVSSVNAQNGVLRANAKPQVKTVSEADYKAHAAGWMVDINKAYEVSKKTGKPIMANFTGSDWCGWCIKLKREVFDKAEFKTWAKDNVVLIEIDFPTRFAMPKKYKEQNYGLQQAFAANGYPINGYPTIWVFNLGKDDKGQFTINALGKTGYVKGVPAFTSGVDAMIKQGKAKAN
jgi:thioredoxin-related protein